MLCTFYICCRESCTCLVFVPLTAYIQFRFISWAKMHDARRTTHLPPNIACRFIRNKKKNQVHCSLCCRARLDIRCFFGARFSLTFYLSKIDVTWKWSAMQKIAKEYFVWKQQVSSKLRFNFVHSWLPFHLMFFSRFSSGSILPFRHLDISPESCGSFVILSRPLTASDGKRQQLQQEYHVRNGAVTHLSNIH